jgi:glutathione reductase (NADPH)
MGSAIDVVVIGAGTAGQTAAYDLVAEGYEVAVVESSDEPGGVCALHGCQAKKYFYELTELAAKSRHLLGKGVVVPPQLSWAEILAAKNDFTGPIPEGTISSLKGNGINYLQGEARFLDARTLSVGDQKLTPRFVVIATGARPMSLPIKGANLLATSNDFLALQELPKKLVMIGGGFISFEFAHFAARLGAEEVVILEVAERVLDRFDTDLVEQLVKTSEGENIQVKTGVDIVEICSTKSSFQVILADGSKLDTDLVVHGAGRVPNIERLNLEAAGINFTNRGISVDQTMQTSNNKVYAVGDCAETLQLARVADQEAHVAATSIVLRETDEEADPLDYEAVPAVLFTYPQLGMVGRTEQELLAEGSTYWKSYSASLGWPNYKRIGMKDAAYKILVDNDGRILGAHFLSDNVSGMVNTFKQAILDGMTATELYQANIMAPYPSRESDLIYMLEPLLD